MIAVLLLAARTGFDSFSAGSVDVVAGLRQVGQGAGSCLMDFVGSSSIGLCLKAPRIGFSNSVKDLRPGSSSHRSLSLRFAIERLDRLLLKICAK